MKADKEAFQRRLKALEKPAPLWTQFAQGRGSKARGVRRDTRENV